MSRLDATYGPVPQNLGAAWQKIRPRGLDGTVRSRLFFEVTTAINPFRSDWREGPSSTPLEQERLIERLERLYTFRDYVSVSRFLRENPFLLDLLLEAHEEIREYFVSRVHVGLEVFTDPEAEDSRQLVALVRTNLSLQEEVDFLDAFYEGWWLDALPKARYKLHIDLK